MTKILKVDQGDYVVQVQPGGNIVLKTSDNTTVGKIVIKGNLEVQGTTTTVNSTNTNISDNIITLNDGELGPGIGVSADFQAGIVIDRGTINSQSSTAQFLFNETENVYDAISESNLAGTFLLQTTSGNVSTLASLKLNTAEVRSISNNNANSIEIDLGNSNAVINLVNSENTVSSTKYHERVTDDSLVNKKFVTSYIVSGVVTVGMADVDKIYKLKPDNSEASKILATTTALEFSINTTKIATVTTSGLNVNNINPYTNNVITLNSVLGLSDQSSDPSVVNGKTLVYSKSTVGSGKSGLFFKNNSVSDELVAKNRALLLSMLF